MVKKGTKRSPISKEDLYKKQELLRKRNLIIKEFYPALKEATISIDEASQLLTAAVALIMEEAMKTLRDTRMKEIRSELVKKLCPNHEREPQVERLMQLFDSQTLFEVRGNMESMKAVLQQMILDEMRNRPLDTMKEDWDRYLNH